MTHMATTGELRFSSRRELLLRSRSSVPLKRVQCNQLEGSILLSPFGFMDPLSNNLLEEDVEDSRWLNDEASSLVGKLSDVIANSQSPPPTADSIASGDASSFNDESSSLSDATEPKVRFCAQVSGT